MFIARGTYGGWFHVYGFTMLGGVLLSLGVILMVTRRRRIPLWPIEIGVVIIILPAMLSASMIGKLSIRQHISFGELFAFWQPGMSIYGGVLGGGLVGGIWVYYCAKRLRISTLVFCDLILPHLLLGQAVGRWGNFFNHELLGQPTTRDHLAWLPSCIKNNLFKWYFPSPLPAHFLPSHAVGRGGGSVDPQQLQQVQYFQPLFLFECLADLGMWLLIVFALPWIWKTFSCLAWRHRHHQTVLVRDFYHEFYFQVTPDSRSIAQLRHPAQQLKAPTAARSVASNIKFKWSRYWQNCRYRWLVQSPQLEALHNPHRVTILRTGVIGLSCWVGYNLIRLLLTFQRLRVDRLFKTDPWVNYLVLSLAVGIGLLWQLVVQVICPRHCRRVGWLYEKQY